MARALRELGAADAAGAAASGAVEPSLDLDFMRGQFEVAGRAASAIGLVTCVRASPAYVEDSRGVWTLVAADTLRRSDCGLLVEEARTNCIRNNAMAGAAEGTPGDLPTHWSVTLPEGCAGRVVETGTLDGIDYVDLGVTGHARGGAFTVAFEAPGAIAAAPAQAWTCSTFFQVVSDEGEEGLSAPRLAVSALSAAGAELEAAVVDLAPERFERAHVIMRDTPAGTASLVPHLTAAQHWSGKVDFVVRIGWPQLELGACPTSPIRTSGAAATRDADHIDAAIQVPGPCTIVAEFSPGFATAEPQSDRRVVWELRDSPARACTLAAGDQSGQGHPTVVLADDQGRGIARSVRAFTAGAVLRVGATLSSDIIESGCVALNGTPNSLLKGWAGGPEAALSLGRDAAGEAYLCGTIRRLTVYPRALGISELMQLTRRPARDGAGRAAPRHAPAARITTPMPECAGTPTPSSPEGAPSARQDAGALAAAARRLFSFRRRGPDLGPDTPPHADPVAEAGSAPALEVPVGNPGLIMPLDHAEAAAAGDEHVERVIVSEPEVAREMTPDPSLAAARAHIADLETRLAAEQARAEAIERTHQEERSRFASQIGTLEATFRRSRAQADAAAQAQGETAARIAELDSARADLQASLDGARRRASELESELTAERARVAEVESRGRTLEERQSELEGDLEQARRRASETQMQSAVEQAARARAEAEQARLERRVATLQAGIEETRGLAAASAQVAGQEAERAAAIEAGLKHELADARQRAAELETALAAEQAAKAERERAADAERSELQGRVAQLGARADEALARANGIAERLAAVEARRAELEEALADANRVASAEAQEQEALRAERQQAHDAERARLLAEVTELQSRVAASDERLAAVDEANAAIAERVDHARAERAEYHVRIEAHDAERAALARQHADVREGFERQLAALQLRVTEALAQAAAAAADLAAAQEHRAELAASLDEARRRASEAEAEMRGGAARQHEVPRASQDEPAHFGERALLRAPAAPAHDDAAPSPAEPLPQPAPDEAAPRDPAATVDVEHEPGAQAEVVRRQSWRAGAAVLALVAAGAAIAAFFSIQPEHRASLLAGVPGLGAPPQIALAPPYVPADAVTFSSGFESVRLHGVEAPAWGAVCRDTGGALWPCGLRARDALVGLIKARAVVCTRAGSGEAPLPASCNVEGRDLGALLVAEGWARPSDSNAYGAEVEDARRARRGLWATGAWGAPGALNRTAGEAAGTGRRS